MSNTENTMSYEQLVAVFGEETAKTMYAQMNESSSSGGAPFPFLKKVSVHGSELGDFGTFVYGTKTEKDADGNKTILEKGTNVGNAFEFIVVNVAYRYTLWDEAKQKGLRSNIFGSLGDIASAVDSYTGKPLPASKDDKKAAGWKLNRINAGLIRANSKAKWEPVIWETTGMLYYTLGEVIGKQANGGLLSGVAKLTTKLESKGSTQFPVIDIKKSSFEALPKDLFTNEATVAQLKEITDKMTQYSAENQYSGAAKQEAAPSQPAESEDDVNW